MKKLNKISQRAFVKGAQGELTREEIDLTI